MEINRIGEMLEEIADALNDPSTLSLPDPSLVTLYQNLGERRIWLDIEVTASALEFIKCIHRWNAEDAGKPVEDRKPIWVYLFNYGGSMDVMWAFIDAMERSTTPVYTVNVGQCGSAAALIFMSGHRRFMMPRATVIIHEGSGQIDGDAVKVLDQADSYRAMLKKMKEFILSKTEIPSSTLSRKKNNDWELDAETCLKYKVCDELVSSLDNIVR